MICDLTKEQKDYIVETYGSSVSTINKISRILNKLDLPFNDEEDYVDIIANIASIMQTEKFEREIKKGSDIRAGYTILKNAAFVLEQKFGDNYLYGNDTVNKVSNLKK